MEKKFIRVDEVAKKLEISESHAYKIMRKLNRELEAKGYNVAYHVAVNGQAAGPFDLSVLAQMATAGQLTTDSLVWKNGMVQWEKAGTVNELKNLFTNAIPPIPPIE